MAVYNISTLAELQAMTSHRGDDCVLLNNIDAAATRQWNARAGYAGTYHGFLPIGTSGSPFTGTFDGGNFTISNLYINRTNQNGSPSGYNANGLLGNVDRNAAAGFIKDLNLFNVDITGGTNVAPLIGYIDSGGGAMAITNITTSGTVKFTWSGGAGICSGAQYNVTFTDCSTSCSITRTGTYVSGCSAGGFIAGATSVTFIDCSASGSVIISQTEATADDCNIGGFCGSVTTCSFTGCVATGDVTVDINTTGIVYMGGFLSRAPSGTTTITECFAYGDVTFAAAGPVSIGGFIGHLTEEITKCGAEGDVENSSADATTNYSGGFVGLCQAGTSVANCYAIGKVCEDGISHVNANIGGFVGKLDTGTIATSYSSGAVYATGTPTNGGGFGGVDDSGTWTDCFWDKTTSGWTTSAGGTGKTTAEMHLEATFTNWDFDDVWEIATFTRAPGSGTTVWLSRVGDYENFKEDVNDADSFSIQLTTTNEILWIEALESLIVGTSGDEWRIGSNELDTPITPNNFNARQQTNYGSKNIQALKVNDTILFVDFVGRKIREMTYSEADRKYVAPDLTALAEHITYSGITSIAHQRNPDSILWVTLDDGSLIAMTYDREQDVVAWSKQPIGGTSVEVQSVCVTPAADEDTITISVKRTINGADTIYIEQLASRVFTDIEDCFFVDSGITVANSPASATIAGLTHLIAETVTVLGDGVAYTPTAVVDASGEVTISTKVEKAQVGLSKDSLLQPMRIVLSGPEGSSMGSITRVNELVISFLNTGAAKYGSDEADLHSIDFTDNRWTNSCEITGLFSGEVVVSMPGGFSTLNPIIITSDGPMPCTVRAIVAKIHVTGS